MRNNPISVSVIIPIYKVESFIVRCVESLFNQSLSEGVEFIFVNDATPDRSVELLQEQLGFFPSRKEQVILLEHAENKGLPAARNTGLSVAKGEYVFHCDSDDFWKRMDWKRCTRQLRNRRRTLCGVTGFFRLRRTSVT